MISLKDFLNFKGLMISKGHFGASRSTQKPKILEGYLPASKKRSSQNNEDTLLG